MVDCLFFRFLEWFIPRDQLDLVDDDQADDGTVFDRSVILLCLSKKGIDRTWSGCGTNIAPNVGSAKKYS